MSKTSYIALSNFLNSLRASFTSEASRQQKEVANTYVPLTSPLITPKPLYHPASILAPYTTLYLYLIPIPILAYTYTYTNTYTLQEFLLPIPHYTCTYTI